MAPRQPRQQALDRGGIGTPRNVLYFFGGAAGGQPPPVSKKLSEEGYLSLPDLPPDYRLFFFFFGGLGGGFAAATSAGVATTGAGINFWIVYCCPIVQKLVVIQ
jgi:hypothetical protein